jgi:hypothetical protein
MSEPTNDNAFTSPEPQVSGAPPDPGAMPSPAADAPEPEGKPKFFDRPLARDPIFWTGLTGIVVLGSLGAFRNPSGSSLNPAGLIVLFIDASLAGAYGWFLAGFLPALVRRLIRRSQRKSALKTSPATNEPSWQRDPVQPGRYRWWDGTAWSSVVAPPPARGPNKVVWLLVPAFLIVLLAGWAGGLPSPSVSAVAKMTQLADAYGASRDMLAEYVVMDISQENPVADLAAKEAAVQRAVSAHGRFTTVLGGVSTQSDVGPFPSLEQLRAYDDAAREFLFAQESYMQRLNACSITDSDCFLEADAWYNANKGDAAERLTDAMQAIANEANNYGGAQ